MSISERDARLKRLVSLKKLGVDPYPNEVNRTHTVEKFLATFADLLKTQNLVSITGRAKALRNIGGLTFLRLEDATGSVQIVLKNDDLGEAYSVFVEHADVGDFFEISGVAFVTKTGEQSILANKFKFLSKAILPLPEKWHGLQDVEIRYRHRELDLLSNPEVKRKFIVRSKFVSALRKFLDDRGFLEVETPILQPIPGGANARPFVTHHNALNVDFYLRIATELYLKRLIVGGFEKIYEIGRDFRNEGIDYSHNPEFTMLEMYQAFVNKDEYIDLVESMLRFAVEEACGREPIEVADTKIDLFAEWPRVTFRDLIFKDCQVDIDASNAQTPEGLRQVVADKKINVDFTGCVGLGEHYDALYKATVRPKLVQPTWVFDYPLELKPLAKQHPEDSTKSASVQLVILGAEMINAYYHELNDPVDQRERLEAQQALREQGSEEAQWLDEDFLRALETGMPPTAGVGLGIDRMVTLITGSRNLKEVILFPTLKPANGNANKQRAENVFGAIKAKLEAAKVQFVTKHHGPNPEDSDEAMGLDPTLRPHHQGAKAIVIKGKKTGKFFHFVLPDDCRLDQKKVANIVGERWSFASAEEVLQITGCVPGSVPPLGSVLGLDTHVDKKLLDNQQIYFNAGSLTDSIQLSLADYLKVEAPEEVDSCQDL